MHREINPKTILVDEESCKLVIGHLKRMKLVDKSEDYYSNPNVNRDYRYRAPELIFGSIKYDHRVDYWGIYF